MKKIFGVLLSLVIICSSCNNRSCKQKVWTGYTNFLKTGDKNELLTSYELIRDCGLLDDDKPNKSEFDLIVKVLIYNKDYSLLKKYTNQLLNKSQLNEEMNYSVTLIKNLGDYISTNNRVYIEKNYTLINSRIQENKQDSLAYLDFFGTKLYEIGNKNIVLEQIDSFKLANPSLFTEIYYEKILKEYIREYPCELLGKC